MTESERWRQWLDNATVPAPASDTRRRPPRRPTTSTTTPAGRTRRGLGRRVLVGGVAAIAVITAVGVGVGLSHRSGGTGSTGRPYTIVTTTAAAPGPTTVASTTVAPSFCTPGRIGAAVVSNTGGDRATGEGAIAEYEYRYFARRDPAAVMEITDGGPGVPGPAQVADGIASIPATAPWCVSTTPAGDNRFETAVRYQPAPSAAPVSWLMVITVAPGDGGYRVVRIEDKPA